MSRTPATQPALAERWTLLDGVWVRYRGSPNPPDPPDPAAERRVLVHVHGFGLSGRYLLPTAERLAGEFRTVVPDLPGFGRSDRPKSPLDIAGLSDATAALLDRLEIERATLVGNSMGCPVICEFAHAHPDRLDRAVLVSPAGGLNNQPFPRALKQLAQDGLREPLGLLPVVIPDYLRFGLRSTRRLFETLAHFPSLQRLLDLHVPTLVVLGSRDPLMPSPARVRAIASRVQSRILLVVIDGAAHAVNFSHPDELAHAIRLFLDDRPVVDDPNAPGEARTYEIHRGVHLPAAGA